MRTPTHHPVSSTRNAAVRVTAALALVLSAVVTPVAVNAQPTPDSSGFITSTDGARLFYAIYGHQPDTVIVPGGMLLAHDLSILRENVTLVFYDPRGRGRSEWIADAKRLTMGDELRDLEAVRGGLGISRAALIGFSYLGLVTALYAADNPTRVTRVALLGPMAPDEQTSSRYAPREGKVRADSAAAKFARAHAAATDTADLAAECRRWYAAYLPVYLGDPSKAADVDTGFCAHKNEAPAHFQWRVAQTMRSLPRRWDYSRKAAAIQAPTLIIEGDQDFASSPDGARRWAELIPNARLIMLAGAGHLTYVERHDRVIPALARFLRGDWPPEAMQLRTSR
jgi:pimeloyl-ACP methyl ester carboxylesterase